MLAAACGGQAFTTGSGDAGNGHATIDASGDGSSTIDGSSDAIADAASDTGSSADAVTISDGPSDGGDGAADGGPGDVFVPDVIEEPPPHCGGAFECVPAVPPGWSGPYELYAAASASPPCSSNFAGPAYDGNGDLSAKVAECGCTCGMGTVACSTPTLSFYSQQLPTSGTCTTANHCEDVAMVAAVCKYIPASAGCPALMGSDFSMSAGSSVLIDGGCPPTPSQAVMPYSWGLTSRACVSSLAPGQADCTAGSVCAPEPAAPFGTALCISQSGNVPCPTTGYTALQVFYGGVDDRRTCSTCICSPTNGSSCSATVSVSTSTNGTCSTNTVEYVAPVSCEPVQQPGDYRVAVTPSGGCTASTVSAIGAATPTGPTTFCCLP